MFVTWVLIWMASSRREHFHDLPRCVWSFMRALTIFMVFLQFITKGWGKFQNAGANFHTFLVIKVQNVRDQISGGRYKHA